MATHRVTARLLPVSPDGAVLLLEEMDPAEPDRPYWSSIGGGLEAGETAREAVVREAREETGLIVDPDALAGPVHRGRTSWSWSGVDYVGEHSWYALALGREAEVSFDRLEPEEVGTVLGSAWLTPADLVGGAHHRPPGLPDIMRAAITAVRGDR